MRKYSKMSIGTGIVFFCSGIILHFAHSDSASYWLYAGGTIIIIHSIITIIKENTTNK